MQKEDFMFEAIKLSEKNIQEKKGGPFGAVVVKNGKIIGRGYNHVVANNDPTAHAEIMAIRDACKNLGTYDLSGCEIYTSCYPCPMCMGAILRSRIDKIYYGNSQKDADEIGFDDDNFYQKICNNEIDVKRLLADEARKVFDKWKEENKGEIEY